MMYMFHEENNTTATTDEENDIRAEGLAAGVDKFFNK